MMGYYLKFDKCLMVESSREMMQIQSSEEYLLVVLYGLCVLQENKDHGGR